MSGRCTGWVLKEGPRDRAMRAVLIVIADATNADGEHSHPGLDNIIAGSLYSRSTVLATLDRLRKEGWIVITGKHAPGRATTYHVNMDPQVRKSQLEQAVDNDQRSSPRTFDRSSSEGSKVQSGDRDTSSSFSQRFTQRDGSDPEPVDDDTEPDAWSFDRSLIDQARKQIRKPA